MANPSLDPPNVASIVAKNTVFDTEPSSWCLCHPSSVVPVVVMDVDGVMVVVVVVVVVVVTVVVVVVGIC